MTAKNWDFSSFDGVNLKIHEMGEAGEGNRSVILLHGLFSNADTNWIKFGHAQAMVDAGFRVIMPDLRAHGDSAAPHDPAAYPADVLVKDIRALIAHLGLTDFDLGGFSLGARTTAKLLATGTNPRKAIIAGMGLQGLAGWARRRDFFFEAIDTRDTAKRGDPHWLAIQFMKSQKIDPVAARLLLATFSDMDPAEAASIETETLVLCGSEDDDNGDPEELAAILLNGHYVAIPGTHMSSVTKAELGQEMVRFLVG
ncbi:MAG: alpha/beta hydrolase [Sphingomonadales bacterium]|nr:alpha/beta hydrolase [Sphingomonadales bacterium]PIX66284.1 MAG: alpha/beta hydrolase [Sphingomonadales bacterium CG_4_10_14_3_um_filter_58_15]NCO48590.1 alpha/beta hydrolase [Sphingomonadales bacterium]NCO98698.1 alpha/beta hydrolase [Sphingomonadales bacterium]NCP26535.1 alpha/beta hydrolase [Sphingomonadales bacterium]